ncbi:hypothetical protein BayCH28_22315 [Mycolicibacterium sp. CH28]|uniref:hypothetical protein n=1 Tax=Mycolicibacterium sp. CH28 TaxID=2512237 RepID=UPI0010806996|nr:hypothetical protein [Mycolicibacterium sp. CH28]TGD85138.1 hypothetical protein BayCH28_22315 [Mycolicibacterium sp. CH28]
MSATDPAGIHYFSFWDGRAQDALLPLWLRVVSMAYGNHTKNGHATFYLGGESTLPELLGKSKRHVQNEIRQAVKLGFLASGSNINCLVLPDEICGGARGHKFAECRLHP